MAYRFKHLAWLPLLPVLIYQGLRTRRRVPRLPDATGDNSGLIKPQFAEHEPRAHEDASAAPPPLRLIGLGDSTIAGVGTGHLGEALTAQVGVALANVARRAVAWRAVGKSGATADVAVGALLPRLRDESRADALLISLGVNDAKNLRRTRDWERDISELTAGVREIFGAELPVFFVGVPHLDQFPALPQPLRRALGARSSALDHALAALIQSVPRVFYLNERADTSRLSPDELEQTRREFFAADSFHPSTRGYAQWGAHLAAQMLAHADLAAVNNHAVDGNRRADEIAAR